jgi:hypothetical protein
MKRDRNDFPSDNVQETEDDNFQEDISFQSQGNISCNHQKGVSFNSLQFPLIIPIPFSI